MAYYLLFHVFLYITRANIKINQSEIGRPYDSFCLSALKYKYETFALVHGSKSIIRSNYEESCMFQFVSSEVPLW